MTREDKAAVVGNLVLERKEAEQQLAILDAKARQLGQEFQELGLALAAHPEGVVFEGDSSLPGQFSGVRHLTKPSLLNADNLKALLAEYRQTWLKRDRLNNQLDQLGIK